MSNCIPTARATEGLMGITILSLAPASAICCTVIQASATLAARVAEHSISSAYEDVDCFFFTNNGAAVVEDIGEDCFFVC